MFFCQNDQVVLSTLGQKSGKSIGSMHHKSFSNSICVDLVRLSFANVIFT